MEKNDNVSSYVGSNQRKYRRFNLQYPVRFKLHSEAGDTELETTSQNVSIGGLLVKSSSEIRPGTSVRFTIRLRVKDAIHPNSLYLVGDGEVVRTQSPADDGTFVIAIQFKAPLSQLLVSHGGLTSV